MCKNFFLSTLCISNGPLKKAFSQVSDTTGTFSGSDKRGHKIPPNKTSPAWIEKIKTHIESFVVMESHYCRKQTKRQYLEASLSIKKMYELFMQTHQGEEGLPK